MKFDPTKCDHCGFWPLRPEDRYEDLQWTGSELPTPFFCSEKCFKAAAGRFFDGSSLVQYEFPSSRAELLREAELDTKRDVPRYSDSFEAQRVLGNEKREWENAHSAAERKLWRAASEKYTNAYREALNAKQWQEEDDRIAKETAKTMKWIEEQRAITAQMYAEEAALAEKIKPRPIPPELRFEHMMCLGPSRSGKTTLLQEMFLQDMKEADPPAYVIIDPKGLLVERIAKLDVFNPANGRLRDRLIIIDPTSATPPALGMFDIPAGAPASYQAELIEAFAYIFSMAGAALTQRQSIPFAYVVRLVFFMRGNLDTLMDVLEDTHKQRQFASEIEAFSQVDPAAARFFRRDFYTAEFETTKQQIKTRINEIMSRPALYKMLGATQNRLSFYECLRQRKIVVVNTAMGELKPSGSSLFGRYIISQTLAAAFSRKERNPAYLVIDEFQDFCDEQQTPRMLRLAGEYRLGISLYFQQLHCIEMTEAMQTGVMTNTSIKYASSPDGKDLSALATSMRCDKEFLQSQQKTETHARFACYVRNTGLSHPFVAEVPLGNIDREPHMSDDHYKQLLAINTRSLQPLPAASIPKTHVVVAAAPIPHHSPERDRAPLPQAVVPAPKPAPRPKPEQNTPDDFPPLPDGGWDKV